MAKAGSGHLDIRRVAARGGTVRRGKDMLDKTEGRLGAKMRSERARTIVLSTAGTPLAAVRRAGPTALSDADSGRCEVRGGV